MTSKFKLRVTSDMKNLATISDFVSAFAREWTLNDDDTFALQMATDEACANVIEHAYNGRPDGTVSIECSLANDEVILTIRDRGRPFDPKSVPRPDMAAPLDKRHEGALGLYLMEKLMDVVQFEFDATKGNKLTMRKKVHREKLPLCCRS
jgi:anti-sigma regulatory factor (Ser/Thr protein kinase)